MHILVHYGLYYVNVCLARVRGRTLIHIFFGYYYLLISHIANGNQWMGDCERKQNNKKLFFLLLRNGRQPHRFILSTFPSSNYSTLKQETQISVLTNIYFFFMIIFFFVFYEWNNECDFLFQLLVVTYFR